MKLIYIANARIPTEKAHGIQIMKMCETFSEFGVQGSRFDVELVVPRRLNHIKKDPFEYYGVERNFKIKKLPCLDLISLDRYIGHLGMWVESVTFNFFVFPYIFFKKADIIYSRDKLLLPLIFFKKNLIFETHTFPKNYFLYSPFLKRLKRMVVITQGLKNLFVARGISPEKILVAPDGVDLEKFNIKDSQEDCRKKLNLLSRKKIVLYAGHLYKWKGATILLEVARNFQFFPISSRILDSDSIESPRQDRDKVGTIYDSQFVFIGGTEKDVEDFKKKAGGLANVIVAGHRPYAEIPYWLKAADILVLPNSGKEEISEHWTSPIKMFEYMASKRPIVASNLPSLREILNENNSILVEPDNPEVLSRGIKEALQNSSFSDKITQQAFQDVQNYTWTKRVEKIFEFLRIEI